ncbi:hypothetical protein [Actinomadura luteofluorescens]|uniref:hypothetical protein n=1 Tax=Actinomadura luteofluorescens TaxID=46163 RepID=UPI003D8A3AA8
MSATTQPAVTAWPDGVIARYVTVGGATVDITEIDRNERGGGVYETVATCTGCPTGRERFHWEQGKDKADGEARAWAQQHASECRAVPKPKASR